MKKLLGVLLAMTLSWPVSATVLHNVEVKGEIQTIASDVRANDPAIYNSGTNARVLAGLSADLVEDVTVNLLFQYANEWGTNANNMNGETLNSYWNRVHLVNANVVLHNLFCAFDLTVGRQFYGDEDSAVMYFGPNHYNAEANGLTRSLDAAKLTYADDVKSLTLIAGRVDNTLGYWPNDGRGDVYGFDARLNPAEAMTLQGYMYNLRDAQINGVHYANAGLYGAKLAFNPEAFRFAAEYARNYGGHDMKSYMVKADIAADMNAVTARGTFLYGKEGFLAFGNYTPGLLVGHNLPRLGELGVWGGQIFNYSDEGVRMFNVGFDVKPADKWTFSLDGYAFQGRHGNHAATLEADLTAKYAHNEYVELFAGVGYAKYGTTANARDGFTLYSRNVLGKDNVKGQLGMLIKF